MSTAAGSLRLAARYARRELRAGLKGFRIFVACLTLGVAIIAGVGSLSSAIVGGLTGDARTILGGDIELRLVYREAEPDQIAHLEDSGRVSHLVKMRTMARSDDGDARRLVELKAVDAPYPLYGSVSLDPRADGTRPEFDAAIARQGGQWGAVVEEGLLGVMGLAVGDPLRLGEAVFEIRGTIDREPDKGSDAFGFGPRVMISTDSLPDTGLLAPGALLYHHYRIAFPEGTDVLAWKQNLAERFPDGGWRVRDFRDASPGVRQFVERITVFLQLVGLTALLVGGLGVSNAVGSYLAGKTRTIAMLKCVGAPSTLIARIYMLQVLALAGIGIAIGVAIGAAMPPLAWLALGDALPLPTRFGIYPLPLLTAAAFGFLTAIAFSLWPLARAEAVPAAGLFRDLIAPVRRLPPTRYLIAMLGTGLLLAGLAVLTATDRPLAIGFVLGALGSFVAFRLASAAIIRLAGLLSRVPAVVRNRPGLRLALANLHRPGSAAGEVVMSLGLGLTVLVAIALIQGNLSNQVTRAMPDQAPDFFFLDIQPDQVATFEETIGGIAGASVDDRMPMLRARVMAFNGTPAAELLQDPSQAWVLRGDRGMTYSATLPENNRVVEGDWWPTDYAGEPLVSIPADMAAAFGVGIGDSMTVNLLGREFELEIASLRRVDWTSLGMNFTIVVSPGTFEAAPHTHIATVHARDGSYDTVFKAITDRFPNVSAVPVREALQMANEILGHIGTATRAIAALTIVAGTMVLAGAIAAGHRRRVYDSVVMKVLGATRRTIGSAFLTEYGLLGLSASLLAALIGTAGGWAVSSLILNLDWAFLPGAVAGATLLCMAITLLGGFAGTWRALGQPAAPLLRND